MECPNCYHQNSEDSKFCNECGHNFLDTVDATEATLSKESERKHVTIMFSDMSGYTAMTERLDPEEIKVITSPEKIKAQLGIQGKKIIGYIGRIDVEEKGIDILLNAYKKLSVLETDLSLLLIGNGTSTEFARNYFDKGKHFSDYMISDNCSFSR